MTLNADVEDGLSEDVTPVDPASLQQDPLVVAPGEKIEQKEGGMMVVDAGSAEKTLESPFTPEQLFGSDVEPGKLPDLDVSIAVINDQQIKVVDLKELETTIVGPGVISQEGAEVINAEFGGFFHSRLSVKEFTRMPSKTQFDSTVQFLKSRISREEYALVEMTKAFFDGPIAEVAVYQEHFQEVYLPYVSEQLYKLNLAFAPMLTALRLSKNVIIPLNGEFPNIMKVPVVGFDESWLEAAFLKPSKISNLEFLQGVKAIQSAIGNANFAYFLRSVVKGESTEIPSEESVLGNSQDGAEITLGELVEFYLTNVILGRVELLKKQLDDSLQYLQKERVHFQEIQEDFPKLDAFILEHGPHIRERIRQLHYIRDVSMSLLQVNHAAVYIFQYLENCK